MTSMLTLLERFERHVVRTPDCWLWSKRMPNGSLHCPTCDALRSKAYRERKKRALT